MDNLSVASLQTIPALLLFLLPQNTEYKRNAVEALKLVYFQYFGFFSFFVATWLMSNDCGGGGRPE